MVIFNPEQQKRGGKRTILHFAGLLGLNEHDEYWIESVKRLKDRFEVVVKGAGGEDVTLVIESFAGDKPSFVATSNLALSYKGSSIPPDFAAVLKKDAFSRLREASIETLSDVLENDPDAISEKEAEVQKISVKKALPDSKEIRVIPEKDEYADFFGREELICRKALALWLFNPCTAILHFDSECIPPPNFGHYMISTTNTPWDNKIRDRGRPRTEPRRYSEPDPDGFIAFTTDLREKDVIFGSLQKEKEIFEYVFSKREAQPILFFQGCVSVVSGTDTLSLFKKYKDKGTSLALYFRGGENAFVKNIFREITVDLRLRGKTDNLKKSNLVNIIGLSDRLTPDLITCLKALGVEINTVLIPQVSADAAKIENAALNVFAPNMFYQDIYDQLRTDTSVEEIEIDAPYGFEGTRRWFEEIAARTGLSGNLEALDAWIEPRREKFEELKKKAGEFTLGFVVRDAEINHLIKPYFTYGIPVLKTLKEMGFGFEIFLSAADSLSATISMEAIEKELHGARRFSIKHFNSFEQMMELLRESGCGAIFSNYFFDWRVTSAGKSILSLQHFEPGFDGAVKTIERIIGLCETPFYRRYSAYLKRERHDLSRITPFQGTGHPRRGRTGGSS